MSEPAWVPLASAPVPSLAMVTALPGSPVDGQEIILVDSLTVPTFSWHLRYVAAKVSNRWIFLGGSPRVSRANVQETAAVATSPAWTAPYTTEPSITLPIAGVYELAGGATLSPNSACSTAVGIRYGTTDPIFDGALSAAGFSNTGSARSHLQPEGTVTVAAGDVVALRYWHNQGGPMNMGRSGAYVRATPVAIGG